MDYRGSGGGVASTTGAVPATFTARVHLAPGARGDTSMKWVPGYKTLSPASFVRAKSNGPNSKADAPAAPPCESDRRANSRKVPRGTGCLPPTDARTSGPARCLTSKISSPFCIPPASVERQLALTLKF